MTGSIRIVVLRHAALCVGLGLVMGLVFGAGGDLHDYLLTSAISTMYSVTISLPIVTAFRLLRDHRFGDSALRRWLVYLGVIAASSAIGTLVSGLVLVATDITPMEAFWATYLRGIQIATAIAIPSTVGAFTMAKLRQRLADTERLASEARLASLESRIRPHFLFNALNSAIALIPDEPARAEKVLERLASLLRSSLATEVRLVPLREELRLVTDYLEIERVRFADRLRYEVDVPDELRDVPIPAFAVQTLVENSVKYAVSSRASGARIVVRARRDGDRIAIEIADDGPGFAGPMWVAGHGLDSLRARLDALFGAAGTLTLARASAASGAAVVIAVPA